MRLLFITHDFPPEVGGIQTYMKEYSDRFANLCDDFAVICPAKHNALSIDKQLDYPVYRIPLLNNTHLYYALRRKLNGIVQKHKPDATFHAQWHTALAASRLRDTGKLNKVFCAVHGRELIFNPFDRIPVLRNMYSAWMRNSLSCTDHLFPVSAYSQSLLGNYSVPAGKTTLHPNGTSPDHFFPVDSSGLRNKLGLNGKTVITTIARLLKSKGFELVFRAMAELRSKNHDLHYLVIGEGPDLLDLKKSARILGISDHVTFAGIIPNAELNPWYNLTDIFVLTPSAYEAFGIVYLEANACKKPVIGSRAYGIPDAVLDGETGMLIEPGNLGELIHSLNRLLSDKSFSEKLGQYGKDRVDSELNWNTLSDRLYLELSKQLKTA